MHSNGRPSSIVYTNNFTENTQDKEKGGKRMIQTIIRLGLVIISWSSLVFLPKKAFNKFLRN